MFSRSTAQTPPMLITGMGIALFMVLVLPVVSTSADPDSKGSSRPVGRPDDVVKDGIHLLTDKDKADIQRTRADLEEMTKQLAELKNALAEAQTKLTHAQDRLSRLEKQKPSSEGSGSTPSDSSSEKKLKDRNRVAVFNLTRVANEYDRTAKLRREIERENETFDKKIKKMQEELNALKEGDDDQVAKEILELKRRIEDTTAERNKVLGKKYCDGEKMIYKEIEAAVETFAHEQGIDIVLFYNDAPDPAMKYDEKAIQKRIGTTGFPMYTAPGVDITDEIVRILNSRSKEESDKSNEKKTK